MCTRPSLPGRIVHERAEVHQARDAALVDAADLDFRRDQLDAALGLAAGRAVTDAILTVPSFSMSMVVPVSSVIARMTAPPLPMTSRIFSGSIFIVMIVGAHSDIFWRGVERTLFISPRMCSRAVLRLVERVLHDLPGDAVDLDVHLQRGDAVARAGHLEVHVAEVIFVTEDVGEHLELAAFLHEAHGHAGDRRLDRHAGIHQREAGAADAGHRAGAVRLEDLGDDADRRTGTSVMSGITASTPRRARLPWPISRRFGEPIMPVSPTLNGGKL